MVNNPAMTARYVIQWQKLIWVKNFAGVKLIQYINSVLPFRKPDLILIIICQQNSRNWTDRLYKSNSLAIIAIIAPTKTRCTHSRNTS